MLLVLLALTLGLAYLLLKLKLRHLEKCSRNIPGPPTYPIIGNGNIAFGVDNSTELLETTTYYTKKYASDTGIMKFWFGPTLFIALTKAEFAEVIAESPHTATKGQLYEMVFQEVLYGVFALNNGPNWRELKKPITRSLSKKLISNNYHPVFVRRTNLMVKHIKENRLNKEYNIFPDFVNHFLDIICETHLGVVLNEVSENRFEYNKNFEALLTLTRRSIVKYHFFGGKIAVKFSRFYETLMRSRKEVHRLLQWVLDERQKSEKLQGEVEYYSDFLLRRALSKRIPDDLLRRQLHDLIVGGTDTSSVTVSSALVFLAMFPEVQEKAYQEQIEIFGDSDRDPTPQDLASMSYLWQVVSETLRHVSTPGVIKYATHDVQVGDYTVPKGAYVFIDFDIMNKNPEYWERPNEFYPEHFSADAEAKRHRYAFLPFGVGTRGCGGFQYAKFAVKTTLSTLLRNFKLSTTMKYKDIKYDYMLFQQMEHGHCIMFEERIKL